MQFIKYILLLIVLLVSNYIGRNISKRYVHRLNELQDLKEALNIFKSKIKFTYEPIPDIFREISENINGCVGEIFKKASEKMKSQTAQNSWIQSVEEVKTSLLEEDKKIINTLSKLLRTNRCRWANKSNRSNSKFFRASN